MEEKTKRLTTNIPHPLLDRITARAEGLWGRNGSESNVIVTALRDWLSQTERSSFDARLDQMERRIEHLLTTRPADGYQDDRPTLDDPQVRHRLRLVEDPQVVTTVAMKLPVLPKKPSPIEISEEGKALIRKHRSKGVGFDFVQIEYLLGYDPDGRVDYSAYERAGFPLLRDPMSYSLEDPTMKQLLDRCSANKKWGQAPLLTLFCSGKLVILDGLARFTSLMEAWRQGRNRTTKVPVELFLGHISDARKEMILRNLHGGPRSLTRAEFERAVDRCNGLV